MSNTSHSKAEATGICRLQLPKKPAVTDGAKFPHVFKHMDLDQLTNKYRF